MSFTPKNLTQGGQMTAYRLRMFVQVNQWISHWMVLLFLVATGGLFWAVTPDDTLRNGFWYWSGRLFSGFLPLMDRSSPATWDISWHCEPAKLCTTKLTLAQLLTSEWMQVQGAQLLQNLKLCAAGCGTVALALFCYIAWYVGRIGKKESEDEYISGMKLTDRLDDVNRQLKKAGEKSDLQIGGLHMVKNAEVMNFLIHGTIGVGKSTLIRWLLDYIRRRGDRAIIYDSGGTFIETHYDERRDKILNPHDSRCENWVLWRECPEVVDYENLTAALIPVEGDSDPFWVSSSRTIFSDAAMQFAAAPDRSIETFLKTLLSIDLKSLREFLKNTPSANLVEEKIEKTAISIRSVLTNYAKSLRYLQGLDRSGRPEFSVREWMTDAQYDNSWLFISTTARHRKAVRPLISMWLSLATLQLQSMGENSERRVWVIGDEIAGLQKIPELNETLAEGRKFGACFVLGIQNIPQLVNIYGREMAKAIFDLLNTRAYGRSPSAEVAKMVEDELGHQRRREAREQNSFGLDQIRDGISISKDKVNEPVVDYDQIMTMPNLRFYVRLPGEYPVVKLALKYRRQKKYHPALLERDFRDRLSPELESLIKNNESAARTAGLRFPTGDELLEGTLVPGAETPSPDHESTPAPVKKADPVTASAPVRPVPEAVNPVVVMPDVPPVLPLREAHHQPEPAPAPVTGSEKQADTPLPANVRAFTPRSRTDTPVPASPALSPAVTAPGTAPAEDQSETRAKASPAPVLPVTPAPVLPAMNAPLRGPSALDMLARKAARKPVTGSGEGDDDVAPVAEAQGEAPELQMAVETDERGELTLRTAGTRKASPESREEAYAEQYGRAGRLMADEEQNILRHRDDYEAYQDMSDHHEPGGYER